MAEIAGLQLTIEDNSEEVLAALAERTPKAMLAVGLTAQINIVEEMGKVDATGRDTVDTGRLRGSISFITQDTESGSIAPKSTDPNNPSKPEDLIKGRAGEGEVIIGSNVEYAAWVNTGHRVGRTPGSGKEDTRRSVEGHLFMERGITHRADELQKVFTDVLKGVK